MPHLVSDAYAENTRKELMRMLRYASVPDAYAQHVLKGLRSVHVLVPDAYAQCTHQFLTRMLSARNFAPPDSHLVLGCGGLYGDSLGPTARPCIVYYLMCVLS